MNIVFRTVYWASCTESSCRCSHSDHAGNGRDEWITAHVARTKHAREGIRRWEAFR